MIPSSDDGGRPRVHGRGELGYLGLSDLAADGIAAVAVSADGDVRCLSANRTLRVELDVAGPQCLTAVARWLTRVDPDFVEHLQTIAPDDPPVTWACPPLEGGRTLRMKAVRAADLPSETAEDPVWLVSVRTQRPWEAAFSAWHAAMVAKHVKDVVVVTDAAGYLEWANPAFVKLTGYEIDEVIGKKPGDHLQGPETDPETVARISTAVRNHRPVTAELVNYTKAGDPYWIELDIVPVFDAEGRHTHYIAIERDITERKVAELEARDREEAEARQRRERRILGEMAEWLYASNSLREVYGVVSKCMQELLPGCSGEMYLFSNSRNLLDGVCAWPKDVRLEPIEPDDCWALRRGRVYAYGRNLVNFRCDHVHPEGDDAYVCLPIIAYGETIGLVHVRFDGLEGRSARDSVDLDEKIQLAIMCVEQISLALANVRLRDELHHQSVRDPLTGLHNRRWFLDTCRNALLRAQERGEAVSLVSVDVDRFKSFNDNHGHEVGDLVLREVAEVMQRVVGEVGTPCRIGGEEFVILLPGHDVPAARDLAEAVRTAVADKALFDAGTRLPQLTVSAGVATYPVHGGDTREVMKAADNALYRAKHSGRNRVVVAGAPPDIDVVAPRPAAGAGRELFEDAAA